MAKRPYCYNTRILYGLAKSKEVGLTDELLHMLVYRETGKSSIKELTPSELAAVCRILQKQKDDVERRNGVVKGGGSPMSRIRGLIRRMFKVDALEWLDYKQCQSLIEAMKAILARQKEAEHDS